MTPEAIAATLRHLSPDYAPTPLLDLPDLAAHLAVRQVLAKNEGRRSLGSFKSLGGTYAGLRALARHAGTDIAGLLEHPPAADRLPALICASDGNHGLAVASAARLAGSTSRIFLHAGVPENRAARIAAQGAAIVRVPGTYDDAVDAAAHAAQSANAILIADTTDDPDDPVVRDVMAGYGVIAAEIRHQVDGAGWPRPSHLFVQAGVGGLAAAMAEGLAEWLAPPAVLIVVEPESVACVAVALAQNRIVRLPGNLDTSAEMLSCGEASAPAMAILRCHGARSVTVSEPALQAAPQLLRDHGGPNTTPSGAAGLAGLVTALARTEVKLDSASRVMILVTEAEIGGSAPEPPPGASGPWTRIT